MINKTDKIVVTGGHGFFGSHIVRELIEQGYSNVVAIHRSNYNLTNLARVQRLYNNLNPDVIIHAAALCGGILANIERPFDFYYENALMGQNLLKEAIHYEKLKKFVNLSTICAYPAEPPIPFNEKDLWNGYPEPS